MSARERGRGREGEGKGTDRNRMKIRLFFTTNSSPTSPLIIHVLSCLVLLHHQLGTERFRGTRVVNEAFKSGVAPEHIFMSSTPSEAPLPTISKPVKPMIAVKPFFFRNIPPVQPNSLAVTCALRVASNGTEPVQNKLQALQAAIVVLRKIRMCSCI